MKRRTMFGIGAALLILMAVVLPASAAGPWGVQQADNGVGDCPDCPGCGQYQCQHQNGGAQADDTVAGDRDRLHLRDGSCGTCPCR